MRRSSLAFGLLFGCVRRPWRLFGRNGDLDFVTYRCIQMCRNGMPPRVPPPSSRRTEMP